MRRFGFRRLTPQVAEQTGQPLVRPEAARLHGPERNFELACDLGVRELTVVLKSDELTILIGQPLQGLPYLPHVVDLLDRRRHGDEGRVRGVDGLDASMAALTPVDVDRHSPSDASQPRAECARRVVASSCPPGLYERLLRGVLGEPEIAENLVRRGVDQTTVVLVDDSDRVRVTRGKPSGQRAIIDPHRDHASPISQGGCLRPGQWSPGCNVP